MKSRFLSALLATTMSIGGFAAVVVPVAPAAAIPVFDATNYSQNILQAARALQQINQQIQSLQNEAIMIQNQARNLQRLDFSAVTRLNSNFQRVDQLMGQAQGISFRVNQFESQFRAMYPGQAGQVIARDARIAAARSRLESVMSAFRGTMGLQAQVVENVQADSRLLTELVEQSQGAAGSLQAQQATNQLLALATQQQFQLQTLMAAQFRVEAMEQARRAQAETEAREATRRFLGRGRAYTPR